ncbi:hypothetical protein EBT31_12575, partial [bacterium]|nr:hypothetical protein [bacterium]
REEVAARAPVLPPEASISELRAAREKEARKVAEAARARTIQPGVERPVEPGTLPIFRPTRIETVPMVRLPRDLQDDLVSIDEEFVPAEEAYKYGPYDEEALLSEQAYFADEQRRRMYRDPETGELRPPTIQEEFIESFAQQTEVPEARFRAEAMERDLQQRKIDEAVARGEDVPFYNRYLAPATYGILTSERQGKGLVETPLGATLRAGLGYVEAAAAEGAFRAFGYEVDENGVPVDPDDTALALKRAREWAGLPEVAYPLQTLGVAARNITTALGAEPETAKRVEEAFKGAVPLPTPLPGFATEREQAKTTPFDPEGVRRVGSEKAPDPLTEPKAALDFYARKVTENVAKGRTFADEWYDTPVMRDYFASTLGDGDWAFYAGMVPSVFTPAGPGTATRLVGKTVSTATDLAKLSDKAKALQAVEQAAEDLRRVPRTLETGGANPEWKALNSRLEDLTRQASAEVSPGVVRKVAESAVKLAVPEQAAANKFIAAIQDPTNKVETVADLYKLAGKLADSGVTPEAVSQVASLTLRNTPDDYVLLSDAIAVPRSMAAQLKPQFERARKGLFLSSATNMKNKLGELVRGRGLPPDHPLAVAARKLQDKLPTANPGRTYFADLSEDLQNELRTFVRSTAARAGKDPDAAFKAFINNAPPAYGPLKLVGEGGRIFRSWDEVPAALRRQAVDAHDVAIARELRQARRASELTRAQIYFDSAEQSLGAAKFFDSPFVRKLRALVGVQHQETLAAARTANEIRRAGQTSLRDMRALFGKKLQETGDVDLALNAMLREQLTQAGESSGKAWDVLYTLLYGERTKDAALAAAEARVPGLMDEFPTLDAVRALDKQLADDKVVLGMLTPDFEAAFLKVTLDEGLRKNLSKVRRDIFLSGAARSFVDNVPLGELVEFGASNNALRNADELLARQGKLLPFTSGVGAKVIPDAMGLPRTFVYDVAASQVEKAIAEGMGEGLF